MEIVQHDISQIEALVAAASVDVRTVYPSLDHITYARALTSKEFQTYTFFSIKPSASLAHLAWQVTFDKQEIFGGGYQLNKSQLSILVDQLADQMPIPPLRNEILTAKMSVFSTFDMIFPMPVEPGKQPVPVPVKKFHYV